MRFSVASVVLAFASVSSCMHITSPLDNACIDLTQQLEVHWYAEANEVVATPYVSIRLANQRGAWPNVNQPLALDHEYTIPTRQGYVVFPRMSNADAEHFASINNGQGFTLRLVPAGLPPTDITHFNEVGIRLAHPGQPCR